MSALPPGRPRIPSLCEVGDWTWSECFQILNTLSIYWVWRGGKKFQRVDYVQNGMDYVAYLRVE